MKKILIHATNCKGLGASHVVKSFLRGVENLQGNNFKFDCVCPNGCHFDSQKIQFLSYKRNLPNELSRFFEIMFGKFFFENTHGTIVLGDIPIRGLTNQIVLVHQPHLVTDLADRKNLLFNMKILLNRFLFILNKRYVKYFFVQSEVMKNGLIEKLGVSPRKIVVMPHPVPVWLVNKSKSLPTSLVRFFYPAAGYAHKNHDLLVKAHDKIVAANLPVKFYLTLKPEQMPKELLGSRIVENLGSLKPADVVEMYGETDCLFFPSVRESYGLPLVEAMKLGLPILCSDLPYARWLCEDPAFYFDPYSPESFVLNLKLVVDKILGGVKINWEKPMKKIPEDWTAVAQAFIEKAVEQV